jgi:glycosyltransferase involved in cell wall biosynthesis
MLEKLVLTGLRLNPEIEQRVVNLGRPGVVGRRLESSGVTVDSLGMDFSLRSLGRLRALSSRLRHSPGGTVVQTWLWHADLLGGLCARASGNPQVVWNLRNSMPAHAATKWTSRAVARVCGWLSRWVPAKIVCNSQAALQAHAALGYSRGKCLVIPNGFDLCTFVNSAAARAEVRGEWAAQPGQLLVGMVARVDPLKDHATFIEAAKRVAAAIPQARFVLVGEGVSRDAGIQALLSDTGLTSRFILEERREDVARLMSALDLFCLASKSEGFPNVLGEAMACATPAVATDVGDARDIIGDDRLIAPPGDPESLARCIRYLLTLRAEERQALGLRQRHRIETRFDIEKIWNRYRELYLAVSA